MKKGPTPKREWQPMLRGVPVSRDRVTDITRSILGREPSEDELNPEMWLNDKYVVIVKRWDDGNVEYLSIRRKDRGHARDWRDFQRIKNDIAGPEIEAVELFPAESRLVDTANQFWLWCVHPGDSLPLGFKEGRIVSGSDFAARIGAVQRDLI